MGLFIVLKVRKTAFKDELVNHKFKSKSLEFQSRTVLL